MTLDLKTLNFVKSSGLVTVVAQDSRTGVVLMVAHADREALENTIRTGEMHYHSRTRGLWHKGATSGNVQRVVTLTTDCDGDAVLARVRPAGPACHAGSVSCFGEDGLRADAISQLDAVIADRMAHLENSPNSYTTKLLADRNLRLKKIGEESAEFLTACADGNVERVHEEFADLLYHALVALRAAGGSLGDAQEVLAERRTRSGHTK